MLDLLFTGSASLEASIRTMQLHNRMAFHEANIILEQEAKEKQKQEWEERFPGEPMLIDFGVIVPFHETMAYVKKHFGYAQLAKDGWFGTKVIYLKEGEENNDK
jgi:hypothetical protein